MDLVDIKGDKLAIHVRYGGGCKEHSFQLNWDGIILESFPPKVNLVLSHNNHCDTCMALLGETLQFDFSTIKDFPAETADLMILTPGRTEIVRYTSDTHHQRAFGRAGSHSFTKCKKWYNGKSTSLDPCRQADLNLKNVWGIRVDIAGVFTILTKLKTWPIFL